MGRVRIDAGAWHDVMEIAEYFGEMNLASSAAHSLLDELERKRAIYARQPGMGDLRDDLGDELRSFTFRKWYVAIYRPLSDGIDVVRVFDARSDYGRHFEE